MLTGKVALVTGGTSGIGKAVCETLSNAGASVCFTGRRVETGESIARQTGMRFFPCDNLDEQQIKAAVEDATSAAGRIDILVNNAGNRGPGADLEHISAEEFDETMGIHLRGAFLMMKAVIPQMKQRRTGVIVNIGSIASHRIGGHSSVYATAKAGLAQLTRWAAVELGEFGIRANSVSPGFIPTEIHAPANDGDDEEKSRRYADAMGSVFLAMQPLQHAGTSEDVARTVLHLASDEAAFITGTDIVIDGGLSLGRRKLLRPSRNM